MSDLTVEVSSQSATTPRHVPRRNLTIGIIVIALALLAGTFLMGRSSSSSTGTTAAASSKADELLATGLQLHMSGQVEQAKVVYGQVLKIDPSNAFANYNLGEISQVAGDNTTAISYYDTALATDPTLESAIYNRALALRDTGNPAEAAAELRKVLAMNANNAGATYNLGILLIAGGNVTEGTTLVNRSIELDPSIKRPN